MYFHLLEQVLIVYGFLICPFLCRSFFFSFFPRSFLIISILTEVLLRFLLVINHPSMRQTYWTEHFLKVVWRAKGVIHSSWETHLNVYPQKLSHQTLLYTPPHRHIRSRVRVKVRIKIKVRASSTLRLKD